MKTIEMTLTYFIKDNQILMPLKKTKIGKGKHNGVGGKLKKDEAHEGCMIRECIEEVGLEPIDYKYMGKITCDQIMDKERGYAVIHIYLSNEWTGELKESKEMKPYWFDIDNIPWDKTMGNDEYWLPLVLNDLEIDASFKLDDDYQALNYHIEAKNAEKKVLTYDRK